MKIYLVIPSIFPGLENAQPTASALRYESHRTVFDCYFFDEFLCYAEPCPHIFAVHHQAAETWPRPCFFEPPYSGRPDFIIVIDEDQKGIARAAKLPECARRPIAFTSLASMA
tara:strand:+ start:403 stop:741 length:339 start_codon:yes stop_codon:yes gene_type:complete